MSISLRENAPYPIIALNHHYELIFNYYINGFSGFHYLRKFISSAELFPPSVLSICINALLQTMSLDSPIFLLIVQLI